MIERLPYCFRLEATRGPYTGSIYCYCSLLSSTSSSARFLSIGRKRCCWLRLLKDLEVSSIHAEFRFVAAPKNKTRLYFCDVKSTNGSKINGEMLQAQLEYPLNDGDLIAMGKSCLRFVQVGHGQLCKEKSVDTTANTHLVLHRSDSSALATRPGEAQVVIELDEEDAEVAPALSPSAGRAFAETSVLATADAVECNTTCADKFEAKIDDGELKPVNDVVVIGEGTNNSTKEVNNDMKVTMTAENCSNNCGVVDDFIPDATCESCSALIGQLNSVERQAHLNECIGCRATITDKASASKTFVISNDAKGKPQKRERAGSRVSRAKKARKPKVGDNNDDFIAAAPKINKPRKRGRADNDENIMLALALTGALKMDKEQQADLQFAATKKKLIELDEKMAKLAKQRVNLIKTLSRIEKTKEKFRKSQVLPPAKVLELLDLKSALRVIFPSNRQAHPCDQRVHNNKMDCSSVAATRYAPSRCSTIGDDVERDEKYHAEWVAVAAISMWKRASQQVFGLQRDSLLYRNSVLRAFLRDDEDADGSVDTGNDCNADEHTDDISDRKAEDREKSKFPFVSCKSVHDWTQCSSKVPDAVKRMFPNWQRDLAFLRDQCAEKIEVALEVINRGAQAEKADGLVNVVEGCHVEMRLDYLSKELDTSTDREEQRLACEFMASVMMQLLAERKQGLHAERMQHQENALNAINVREKDCQQREQQCAVDKSQSEAEEEPNNVACEELLKPVTASCYD